jgi:uncharacterized protein (DUF1330 family)
MAGLWISHVEVIDPEGYAEYAKGSGEVIPSYGGEFIARGGRYQQLEGEERARNVVIRFPTLEAAVECYHSPEYQAIVGRAKASANRNIVIVETND